MTQNRNFRSLPENESRHGRLFILGQASCASLRRNCPNQVRRVFLSLPIYIEAPPQGLKINTIRGHGTAKENIEFVMGGITRQERLSDLVTINQNAVSISCSQIEFTHELNINST